MVAQSARAVHVQHVQHVQYSVQHVQHVQYSSRAFFLSLFKRDKKNARELGESEGLLFFP